ncbi:FAS1-like dehydratase domain-containing protein [Sphaerisporangium perillae]|uniref:FAS1-like dehydratase domain-containing protein n=1 Tax=Sphaerisporangium perillae TaxID=2935860 RepID=UPI00200E57D6|nr:MaoC family dehydratase N-terminal domain-containing protein [Sphaerisporangium perillae]
MTSSAASAEQGETQTSRRTELITPEPAEALAGLLDIDPPSGDEELPALWHWIYLLERRRQRDLGPDGHPTHGIPAPPGPGRLRMFAGGRVSMHTPLRFGEPATRTTRIVRTAEKDGKSGPLTFVTVRSDIEQGGRPAITDEQDIVYRAPGSTLPAKPSTSETPAHTAPEDGLALDVDSVVLFRFSALTYNAHRIHYDSAYAAEEGYPGLVVHGPLQALMMGELIRRSGVPLVGQEFAYRLVAPAFGEQRLTVAPDPDETCVSAQVRDGAGRVTATSTLRPWST